MNDGATAGRAHCVVVTHKESWRNENADFVTVGGFPRQIEAISELFERTTVVLPLFSGPPPAGSSPIAGRRLSIAPLSEPRGTGLLRKLALLMWLPANLSKLWFSIASADVVHALVPGDIGFIGIVISMLQGKRLFVRHCGTWARPVTNADRLLHSLLERIASDSTPVFATGGGVEPPSPTNRSIHWVFSTTLTPLEVLVADAPHSRTRGGAFRLVTACRLTAGKNISATLRALALVRAAGIDVTFDIAGDGPELLRLKVLSIELGIADRVVFHGNLDHEAVLRLLVSSDAFVFPTRVREGFPKAVLEAMACGLPVIASAVSVIPYLLSDGAGIVLADLEPRTIARSIEELKSDRRLCATISARATFRARDYTLDRWRAVIGQQLAVAWSR